MLSLAHHLWFLAEDGGVRRVFSFDPAVSVWLLLPGLIVATALVYALYRAQRQIASRRLVSALVAIRATLIVLLFALLLRPVWVWSRTISRPPVLWLVLDQSLSMAQRDAQATPVERLRWAAALGMLPRSVDAGRLARTAALLSALRGQLGELQRQAASTPPGGDEGSREALIDGTKDWNERLKGELSRLTANPPPQALNTAAIADSLRPAQKLMEEMISAAQARPRGQTAGAGDAPWARLAALLESAAGRLAALADAADAEAATRLARDPMASEALAGLAHLRRADLAVRSLTNRAGDDAGIAALLGRQQVKLVTFSTEAKIVSGGQEMASSSMLQSAAEPVDGATDLAGALRLVFDQATEGESASVLVVSDGRANAGADPADAARQLASRGIRVFTLAVGSRQLAPDAAVESLEAPNWVYKDDTVRVSAGLRFDSLKGKQIRVELLRDGNVVDSQTMTPASDRVTQVAAFQDKPPSPDVFSYEVRIAPVAGEAVADNNARSARVAVKKEKLQVLIVEDQPRWEYRYLANYLNRDHRVHIQTVLLDPARVEKTAPPAPAKASPRNDKSEAQILPQTLEEWSEFDVIVLGDVAPEFLTPDAQRGIAAAVKDRGKAVVVIAGPLNMPARYAGAPLSELLPVESTSNWSARELADHARSGFSAAVAPEGASSILSQLGLDPEINARLWSAMPLWYWHGEQTQARASASVLWQIADPGRSPQAGDAKGDAEGNSLGNSPGDPLATARRRALLATMPAGQGRALYLAGDSTWRLRQVAGENVHERFWGEVIRWATGSDMPAGGKRVRFGGDRPSVLAGQAVSVSARVTKEDFSPLSGQSFSAVATSGGKVVAEAPMTESANAPGFYHAQLRNLPPGPVDISLRGDAIEKLLDADPATTQKTVRVEVLSQASVERQNINPDRAALQRIAREGNGIALDAEHADVLADFIPQSFHRERDSRRFGLFTDPGNPSTRIAHWGFLGLFVALITAEWILRKAGGLV